MMIIKDGKDTGFMFSKRELLKSIGMVGGSAAVFYGYAGLEYGQCIFHVTTTQNGHLR